MASFRMASSRADERESGLRGPHLLEPKRAFSRRGAFCLTAAGFEAILNMSDFQNIFLPFSIPILTTPLGGSLNSFSPVTLETVSQSPWEPIWDQLVQQYHYLGFQKLLGHRLKYLAFIQDQPVAALSFSAPALKLRVRDRYIGWSAEQRKVFLDRLANNSRFLIFPKIVS